MEIGTEISKKIRAAIKGKLQELGAYVDEELPDYIMVMVANKKSAHQMADDLSLFLGNNTIKFTVWLHGVLEKLRSAAVEPTSLRPKTLHSDTSTSTRDDRRGEESRALAVSSSRADRLEGRVSSSAHEHHSRRGSSDRASSRLTSAVKPLLEPASAEVVIDIKPDLDDDLITEDPMEPSMTPGQLRSLSSRSVNERSRQAVGSSARGSGRAPDNYRSSDVLRGQERSSSSYGHGYREGNRKEELSRKRKAPVASSVVRVHRSHDRGQESDDLEDDEDEEDYGIPSRVSLPSKPERKPTLPPAKQANKNLILKAISEAQASISKTTAAYAIPQRQTVPVAPRTRSASDEMNRAAIRLVQEHLHALLPEETSHSRHDGQPPPLVAQPRSLASRLQLEHPEEESREQRTNLEVQMFEAPGMKSLDTRSFIMRKPELEQTSPIRNRTELVTQEEALPSVPRMVQAREKTEVTGSASPKFIVTLDGVPSPLASLTDQEMTDPDDTSPNNTTSDLSTEHKPKPVHLSLNSALSHDDGGMEEQDEMDMEVEAVQAKRQKILERCKFWPACKSGDECPYHHPKAQCKTFPSCVFGDKCLFIHPNCKYDAKCSKPDCPYTHVSRRTLRQPARPVPAVPSSVCRFFPDCKKVDCTFYHPKPCRFAAHCKRAGCTFYHPASSVPPRHALKWTKTQKS
ncbi:zinc finger CCCH domain-containing protein 14 isoform X3 [Electrophorus electricus]|uniref:zinc finger CCCH domain-containing protein 14 isoform X3 n=1 Tax=Electrophorus electricus TaxID=8005 RepID=UPI0015D06E20|nr:zinc finger CCCH domain-containing protein 14 isoform X3 [Electrophorus electricus]